MSRTTLYAVGADGEVQEYAEFRNSHGSAGYVWRVMGDRYIGPDAYSTALFSDGMQRLWDLWRDTILPLHHRAVMLFTFDHVMVRAEDFVRLAEDMEAFVRDFYPDGSACSLPEQAATLREMATEKGIRGACWQQTRVAESLWYVYGDEGDDEGRAYNIDVDDKHWWLYETLNAAVATV